ncbi:ABC transporter ATP-binding protein [Paenibacillus sp. DLE-14]|uniref:ABC transporter ATP-binding protein n=2 Tax=Paenibacillus lignilyticus TaxID=1172615 RepID=A0ABS5CB90_9BACL|nr:ABC transporter ATP-binding protein [Paenibacillus lignilyticus]
MAMLAEKAIHISNVTKRYGTGTLALREVDLDIGEGEFVSLVGPSGCGKSTLLRIMAGLGEATEGVVSVLGQPSQQLMKTSGQLGFVFQEANLMPWRTVIENVELPLELRGVGKKERREEVDHVLRLVRLENFRDSYPKALSGGMKMRVSIARSLVSNPKILFMDEPFGALDEMTRHHLHQELLEIWRQSKLTVVFVTHNVFEAVYLSSKVVIMKSYPGQIGSKIDIPAPYPRDDEFQASATFGQLVDQVSKALKGG